MSVETVRAYLQQFGKDQAIRELDTSSATVELAAQALGVEGARIAKTLSLHGPGGCILVVTAGDRKINSSKFKARFASRLRCSPQRRHWRIPAMPWAGSVPLGLPTRRYRSIWTNPSSGLTRFSRQPEAATAPLS